MKYLNASSSLELSQIRPVKQSVDSGKGKISSDSLTESLQFTQLLKVPERTTQFADLGSIVDSID
jgi:hypothetical protein